MRKVKAPAGADAKNLPPRSQVPLPPHGGVLLCTLLATSLLWSQRSLRRSFRKSLENAKVRQLTGPKCSSSCDSSRLWLEGVPNLWSSQFLETTI